MSLIDLVRSKFLSAIRSVQPANKYKVLISDDHTNRLLNNVLSAQQIIEENITGIEHLHNTRHSNTTFEAIYILYADNFNVQCLVTDFRSSPKYAAAHVFFVDSLEDRLFGQITAGIPQDLLKTLVELYIDFFPLEGRAFTFKNINSFLTLYNPACKSLVAAELASISARLVCVCASLGEYPIIRYYNPTERESGSHTLCERLAIMLQKDLDDFARNNSDFPPPSARPRATLLILDRTLDLIAPLLHEFTYQAMVHDMLSIRSGNSYKFTIEGADEMEEKESVFDDRDPIWVEYRHEHMRDTIDRLMEAFNKFISENPNFTNKEKATNVHDMRDMLASLPEFQDTRDRFSLHLTMAQECMKLFEQKKLPVLGLVEQTLATGLSDEGKAPKGVLEDLIPLLDDAEVEQTDRQRLLTLYVLFKDGLLPEDLEKLLKHTNLSGRDSKMFKNLDLLGVNNLKDLQGHKTDNKRRRKVPRVFNHESFELSRFVPALKSTLEEAITGTLDVERFPYTRDQPVDPALVTQASLRSARPNWAKSRGSGSNDARQRQIVFMLGGATYSEVRSAYEISEIYTRDVFIGASDFITPDRYLKNLTRVRDPKERMNDPQIRGAAQTSNPYHQNSSQTSLALPSNNHHKPPSVPRHDSSSLGQPGNPPNTIRAPDSHRVSPNPYFQQPPSSTQRTSQSNATRQTNPYAVQPSNAKPPQATNTLSKQAQPAALRNDISDDKSPKKKKDKKKFGMF